jgi:hypothetical protein
LITTQYFEVTDTITWFSGGRDALEDAGAMEKIQKNLPKHFKEKTVYSTGVGGGKTTPLIARLQYPIWEIGARVLQKKIFLRLLRK